MKNLYSLGLFLVALWLLAGSAGCLHLSRVEPMEPPLTYLPQVADNSLAAKYAPAWVVHNPHQEHNRLGSPQALGSCHDQPSITVDSRHPAIYCATRPFATAKGRYTNLIYRVHFPATPASLLPFFIGAGRNMGLMTIITLDQREQPVLITSVATCGCYAVSIPTGYLPASALPPGWSGQPLEVYGETLPARLNFQGLRQPRLVVEVRPGEHRVMGLKLVEATQLPPGQTHSQAAPLVSMERLTQLPCGQSLTSLYYQDGWLAGHVKGAWKPWETLLLGLVSCDPVVGMDKDYGDPRNPFYTSLKPWLRQESDMNDFAGFLRYWGWGL